MRNSFKLAIAAAVTGATAFTTLGASPAIADDHDHEYGDDLSADISRVGFVLDYGDTALLKVDYTCPEDAEAAMKVWLEQDGDRYDDDWRSARGGHDSSSTRGSEFVYGLDCTGYEERTYVRIDADHYGEWMEGDAEAKALLISRDRYGDDDYRHGHGDRYDKFFTKSDVYLVDKSHDDY